MSGWRKLPGSTLDGKDIWLDPAGAMVLGYGPYYRYTVDYYTDRPGRPARAVVVAADADDARRRVSIQDPSFTSTVRSPRRGRSVVP